MSDKMREALEWCARALDKEHPAAIAARLALAEQPAKGDGAELREMLKTLGFDNQCPDSIRITLESWRDGYAKWLNAAPELAAQGEAAAYWGAADSDGTLHLTMSADDGNRGQFSREQVNDFINEAIADGEPALRLVALYTAPPAQHAVVSTAPAVPDDVAEAARYFKAQGGHIAGLGASRAANILWDYINDVLAAAPEQPRN